MQAEQYTSHRSQTAATENENTCSTEEKRCIDGTNVPKKKQGIT